MKTDRNLDAVRNRDEFKVLLRELEAKLQESRESAVK
jgi:hypothetical protein